MPDGGGPAEGMLTPTLGELDLHLLNEGRHLHLQQALGAHLATVDGVDGTAFSVPGHADQPPPLDLPEGTRNCVVFLARPLRQPGSPVFAFTVGPDPANARYGMRGFEALPEDLAERLGWDQPYPPGIEADLLEELRESHCGALPEAALAGMLRVQRLWDAWMADSLLAAGGDGAILIAGSGHAREDRAVPWHLRQRGAGESLTVALVEVIAGREAPGDYAAFEATRFDYVWFTPRVDEDDPCAGLPRGPAQPD